MRIDFILLCNTGADCATLSYWSNYPFTYSVQQVDFTGLPIAIGQGGIQTQEYNFFFPVPLKNAYKYIAIGVTHVNIS